MNPPPAVDESVAPFLTLLGEKIRQQGFTELEVEEALSWDPSHIRQLASELEGLRVAEVLQVLGALGVEPSALFTKLYGTPPEAEAPGTDVMRAEIAELTALVDTLVHLLVRNEVVTAGELMRAVAVRAGEPLLPVAEESRPLSVRRKGLF